MFRHHITVAIRNLWRNKFHAVVNISGLAIGISACLVIYLIVSYELSFNREVADAGRIFRIHSKFTGAFSGLNRGVPGAAGRFVKENFKGIESVAAFQGFQTVVTVPDHPSTKPGTQHAVIIASPEFFEVFNIYKWKAGSPDVLREPNRVVLTEAQALKYFGNTPIQELPGKDLVYRDSLHVSVAGIVQDHTMRTDLQFTDFISYATVNATWLKKQFAEDDWASVNSSSQLFVKVMPGMDAARISEQFPLLTAKVKEKSSWDALNTFGLQPLADLHFNSENGIFDFSREPAHLPTLIALIVVAVLLLVMGAINFVNLETAQSVRRAREVGVRKVLGSTRTRLIIQFVGEGMIVTLIALALSLPLTELAFLYFSEFIPQGLVFHFSDVIPFLAFSLLLIGVLASAYPAFILSGFLPASALKGESEIASGQTRASFMRKSLIVFQFAFAQVLILGTLMVGYQVRYLLNMDLGFRKEAIVYFDAPWWESAAKVTQLRTLLAAIPELESIAVSDSPPAYNGWSSSTVEFKGGKEPIKFNAYRKFGEPAYLDFYNIKLIAGRNVELSDTVREVLINETMMRHLGFDSPEKAIGSSIVYSSANIPIVGVVHDFHFQPLRTKVEPMIIGCAMADFRCFNVRLDASHRSGEEMKSTLARIESEWKKIFPDQTLRLEFLDETIRNFYRSEQRMAKLTTTAMVLAILISCLGLFALASYTALQRTKEIGIRKVLGASVRQVVWLLSREFVQLVVLAFLIAAPLAWFGLNQWLMTFSYHADLGSGLFVLTILAGVLLTVITVSYQTIKAAGRNPVESLRSE